MSEAAELERVLAELATSGRAQVHENGQRLAALSSLHCEVRSQGNSTLIHLWSDERNLVRRILRVAELSADRVVLQVQRFGRSKPDILEFTSADWESPAARQARESSVRGSANCSPSNSRMKESIR